MYESMCVLNMHKVTSMIKDTDRANAIADDLLPTSVAQSQCFLAHCVLIVMHPHLENVSSHANF